MTAKTQTRSEIALGSLGKKTAIDAKQAGVPQIEIPATIPEGDGYRAVDHLPASVTLDEVQEVARTLATNPDLDQIAFVRMVEDYQVDVTPSIDDMLENQKARNAGEAGQRVIKFTERARGFSKALPQLNAKFLARLQAGQATGREIVNNLRYITKALANARAGFQDLLELADIEETYHYGQYTLSINAVARDLQISKEERDREAALVHFTAILECLKPELDAQIKRVGEPDLTRLQNVSLLLVHRVPNMRRMISKAGLGIKRWAMQANANALTAMDQLDFAKVIIADWKSDVASELDAQSNIAMSVAYLVGLELAEEQANATADRFDEQMSAMARVLESHMTSLDTITRLTQSLVNGGKLVGDTLLTLDKTNKEDAKLLLRTRKEVADSEAELRKQLAGLTV